MREAFLTRADDFHGFQDVTIDLTGDGYAQGVRAHIRHDDFLNGLIPTGQVRVSLPSPKHDNQ